MPDLATMMLRRSVRSIDVHGGRCSKCERTPLPGERMHELDSGRTLCELCFAALPDDRRVAVRTERVHWGPRRLSVVPKAA